MKKLIIAAILLVCSDTTFAQIGIGFGSGGFGMGMNIPINRNRSDKGERLENQVKQLKRDLDLNDDQVIQVRGLLIERDRSKQRGGDAMTKSQFDQRMQEILTPEQNTRYNELKQGKHQNRRESKTEDRDTKKEELPESDWDDVYR